MTKSPNEKAKETGHQCMDSRARSFLMSVPSLCEANGSTCCRGLPTLAPRGHIHFWKKTNLHFLWSLLQLPERQASLAESPTCLASSSLRELAAKAPAREETAAPLLPSCGNPGLPQLPQDKHNPKPGTYSQSSNFIYKTSQMI